MTLDVARMQFDKVSVLGPESGLTISKKSPYGITVDDRYKGGAVALVCESTN